MLRKEDTVSRLLPYNCRIFYKPQYFEKETFFVSFVAVEADDSHEISSLICTNKDKRCHNLIDCWAYTGGHVWHIKKYAMQQNVVCTYILGSR